MAVSLRNEHRTKSVYICPCGENVRGIAGPVSHLQVIAITSNDRVAFALMQSGLTYIHHRAIIGLDLSVWKTVGLDKEPETTYVTKRAYRV